MSDGKQYCDGNGYCLKGLAFTSSETKSEAALVEALEWALAEIEGRTLYSSPEQRENCLALAHDALRARAQAPEQLKGEGR